jgi:hypothetical protein
MEIDIDKKFFAEHPDRFAHIRTPKMVLEINQQRSVQYVTENENEFISLGEHQRHRRRIIVWRVPRDNVYYNPDKPAILKIPFLLFADETVEDTDEVLLPIVHEIMVDEARKQGVIGNA